MKKIIRYILALVLLHSVVLSHAQKGKVESVADDYRDFSYVKTSEVLLEVAEKGYRSQDLLQRLANSFYFINDMDQASQWYGELFKLWEEEKFEIDSEYYFRYAMALKGIGDYEGSDQWMKRFNAVKPSDSRGKAFLSKVDYKSDIESRTDETINLINLGINTPYSDFGTAEQDGGIVFASSRGDGKLYEWNNQPYLDLYSSQPDENGFFKESSELSSKINTKFHESIATFTQDEQLMFFTRNNYFKRRAGKDDLGINRLQLFRAIKNSDGEWDDIAPVHFNSSEYSVAHPSLNKEGNRLYFASDMPGTKGASDIYVVDVYKDGSLGTPKNLGSSVNTEGQESFPFVNTNGDLYYSTNGLPGLGGRDIFKSEALDKKLTESNVKQFIIKNVGKPINSKADDFGYYENLVTKKGFFSSNREGGKGDDDIYSFTISECEQFIAGTVKDKSTDDVLPGATVILFDSNANEIERVVAGNDGTFTFNLACDKEYLVRGEKETYSSDEKRFTTPKRKQELQLQLLLEKDEQEIAPCTDLAKVLDIPIIYFDFDKYDIRYDAEIELQKVIAVLNQYPTLKIDIRSHTDCRATMTYNERLSENRAQSTKQYLIDNGISFSRLSAKGYGESQLVNDCGCEPDNNSSCSEEEHQKNRRSEFIITSFKGEDCID